MKIEFIKKSLEKIQATKVDDLNIEEYADIVLKVMEDFDKKDSEKKSIDLLAQEYYYLIVFFHKFACKLYGNKIGANFNNQIANNMFNGSQIIYSVTPMAITKNPAIWNIYAVMHENRHAVQHSFFKKKMDDVLSIEPLSIAMIKEEFFINNNPDFYKQNHSNFIIESDANLITDSYLMEFVKKYCQNNQNYLEQIKARNNKEKTNFSSFIHNRSSLADYEFKNVPEDREMLPVFYEIDKNMKKTSITEEHIKLYPILEFMYNKDGKAKTYQQIMNDKEMLLKKFDGDNVKIERSSLKDYSGINTASNIGPIKHINSFYETIIKTDPLLHIEDSLNLGNMNVIEEILTECPQLMTIYKNELSDLFLKYLSMSNYSKISALISSLNNDYLINIVNTKYNNNLKNDIYKMFGIVMSDYIPNNEQLKSIEELDSELKLIYSGLEQKIKNGELKEKEGLEYQKGVLKLYDSYKQNIKQANNSQTQSSFNLNEYINEYIRNVQVELKPRYRYDDMSETEKNEFDEKIDEQIEKIIVFAHEQLQKGIIFANAQEFENLYNKEMQYLREQDIQEQTEEIDRIK